MVKLKETVEQCKEKATLKYWRKSIYRELFGSLFMCALISILLYIALYNIFGVSGYFLQEHVSYENSRFDVNNEIFELIDDIYQHQEQDDFQDYVKYKIEHLEETSYLTDEEGTIQFESTKNQTAAKQIDLRMWKDKIRNGSHKELLTVMYPIVLNSNQYYLLREVQLRPMYIYTKEILYLVCGVISLFVFLFLVLMIARKKITYLGYLGKAAREISEGNLDVQVSVQGTDELAIVAENMNAMETNLVQRIEREHKQYEEQNELITNMSHDLKTPITVLLGYLDILRTHQYKEESDLENYLEISYDKTVSLRNMVLKLFELSKTNGQEKLQLSDVNLSRLLRQLVLEYEPIAEESKLKMEVTIPNETIMASLDLEKMTAVLHNMMSNAMKYTTSQGVVQIQLSAAENEIKMIFMNPCQEINQEELQNIFHKFYRGDKARNSAVEGNGIGLALVKQTVELHGGTIFAEYKQGNICFTIRLRR